MSCEEIKKVQKQVVAKLENLENAEDILELSLEELTAISGANPGICYGDDGYYPSCGGGKVIDFCGAEAIKWIMS